MFCDTTSCEFVNSYSHCLFRSPFGLVLENSLPLNIQYMITPTYRRRVQHERTMGKGAGFYFHASFSIRGWDEFVNMAKKRRDRSGVWGQLPSSMKKQHFLRVHGPVASQLAWGNNTAHPAVSERSAGNPGVHQQQMYLELNCHSSSPPWWAREVTPWESCSRPYPPGKHRQLAVLSIAQRTLKPNGKSWAQLAGCLC